MTTTSPAQLPERIHGRTYAIRESSYDRGLHYICGGLADNGLDDLYLRKDGNWHTSVISQGSNSDGLWPSHAAAKQFIRDKFGQPAQPDLRKKIEALAKKHADTAAQFRDVASQHTQREYAYECIGNASMHNTFAAELRSLLATEAAAPAEDEWPCFACGKLFAFSQLSPAGVNPVSPMLCDECLAVHHGKRPTEAAAREARAKHADQPATTRETLPNCGCIYCLDAKPSELPPIRNSRTRMVVCPQCGNKRCPKATYHGNECTGSNESGQPGSVFGPKHADQPAAVEQAKALLLTAINSNPVHARDDHSQNCTICRCYKLLSKAAAGREGQ